MAALYSQTTDGTFTNANFGDDWWYAWEFVPTATGTPTSIDVYLEATSAGSSDEIYIRSSKSASASNFGSATGITWSASGIQTINLSGGSTITSGNTYFVCVHVTSGTNFPKFQLNTSSAGSTQGWRSSSAGGDPTTAQYNNYPTFVLNGTLAAGDTINVCMFGSNF